MKRAIDTLKTVSCLNNTRSVAILADMLELGAESSALHCETGKYLSENKIDILIAYGPLSENICRGFSASGGVSKELFGESELSKKKNYYYFKDKKQLCESLGGILKKDDAVLFKGSRANKLEDIIDYLLKA
jgi:UDP-N-acetylmuramoyl-tripeptide--D-alanyl-D-alanine ligase